MLEWERSYSLGNMKEDLVVGLIVPVSVFLAFGLLPPHVFKILLVLQKKLKISNALSTP